VIDWAATNIAADPLFLPDGRLSQGSPCVNSGDTAALPFDDADLDHDGDMAESLPLDLAGNVRVQGGTVDMGAFESVFVPLAIVSTNPPQDNPFLAGDQPFRDVLQPGAGSQLTQGIGSPGTPSEGGVIYRPIHVTFNNPVALLPADVTLTCNFTGTPPGSTPCPVVAELLDAGGNVFLITLDRPIPPGGCTTIEFGPAAPGLTVRYESLPGDASMNGVTNTQDLLTIVQALNQGLANLPGNLARYDMNRTGIANTQDLLRLVQLLNGTNTIHPWNGFALLGCPSEP
jgi:hypothetical protein